MNGVNDMQTACELASSLRCSVEKVYRMARDGEIPYVRVGREYRFSNSAVLDKLANPAPSWSQSRRSKSRKRAA